MPDFEEVDFSRKKFVKDEVCSIIEEHSSRRLKGLEKSNRHPVTQSFVRFSVNLSGIQFFFDNSSALGLEYGCACLSLNYLLIRRLVCRQYFVCTFLCKAPATLDLAMVGVVPFLSLLIDCKLSQ